MEHQAVYPHSGEYAVENGEIELYRASRKANYACKEAIEQAIRENFDGMHLNSGFEQKLFEDFGIDRVQLILASTLQVLEYDGRFSRDNKEWAKSIPIPEDKDGSGFDRNQYLAVNSHPAVLDGFVNQVRKAIAAAREQPEQKPSIKEQLSAPSVPGDKPSTEHSKNREVR